MNVRMEILMSDESTSLGKLKKMIEIFTKERDWMQNGA